MKFWVMLMLLRLVGWASVPTAAAESILQPEPESRYSLEDARKVQSLIEKIEQAHRGSRSDGIKPDRKVTINQEELNAYIAHRIDVEREEVMRELEFKLFPDNRIEMKVFIDLHGRSLPRLLRPEMTFYIGGELESREGAVRLHMKELFLEDQSIQPAVLDLVIMIASRISGSDTGSLQDWYQLPFGIREVRTRKGRADFFY